jgi:hypothetical protein
MSVFGSCVDHALHIFHRAFDLDLRLSLSLEPFIAGQIVYSLLDLASHTYIEPNTSYPSPQGMFVGGPASLLQKVNPGSRFYEIFYRYRFRSNSNESSRREMFALSSYVVDLPPSVIRK